MAEADTSPPWLASSMDERSRGNEGSDKGGGFSRPSPSHSRVSSPADTPRSTASGVVNLLESERRLLQNQAQSEMARKDEEIRHLRRALLVLSDEASEHAALQAEITACKAALERERESRVQGEIELERALTLLKDNVAQRVAEQEASERFTQDWQENFATAMKSEQHKATQEALRQQERRLREEMRELKEHARQKYEGTVQDLRSLEGKMKTEGAHKLALEEQLATAQASRALMPLHSCSPTTRSDTLLHVFRTRQGNSLRSLRSRSSNKWPIETAYRRLTKSWSRRETSC